MRVRVQPIDLEKFPEILEGRDPGRSVWFWLLILRAGKYWSLNLSCMPEVWLNQKHALSHLESEPQQGGKNRDPSPLQ
jgi:hypothetical protein